MSFLDFFTDKFVERTARRMAQNTSRRGFLARAGAILVGAGALPLLPISKANASNKIQDPGDPTSCDYWRYCAVDGFLCTCCGGTVNTCPPGTEMSPITWIGTCRNPADGRDYIISYNDCCGGPECGQCLCNRNEGDRPMSRPQLNNDINWCLGTSEASYTCSTAIIVGTALDE